MYLYHVPISLGAGLMWNPGIPTLLATATVTGEVTVWEVRGDSIVQASTKQTFGASSLCWSSKVNCFYWRGFSISSGCDILTKAYQKTSAVVL